MNKEKLNLKNIIILSVQGLVVLWALGFMAFIAYSYFLPQPKIAEIMERPIIILTGDVGRIEAGLSLAQSINSPAIFITGVDKRLDKTTIIEKWASGATDSLEDKIDIDHDALNTFGNAEQSKLWLNAHNYTQAIVVTSSYHLPRTKAVMRDNLPKLTLTGYPVSIEHLNPTKLKFWRIMRKEFNKTVLIKACLLQNIVSCLD
tara:strand:- start:262434 stop:263042 length:609 start_codon:yes stop_codon:yes gene_type:complete